MAVITYNMYLNMFLMKDWIQGVLRCGMGGIHLTYFVTCMYKYVCLCVCVCVCVCDTLCFLSFSMAGKKRKKKNSPGEGPPKTPYWNFAPIHLFGALPPPPPPPSKSWICPSLWHIVFLVMNICDPAS